MSVSSINNTPNYINLPTRAERITTIDNRITANNRQITNLKNQITAQQEVSTITKEVINNNAKLIGSSNKKIDIYEKQIDNNINSINLIKQIVSNNEKIIGTLQETQVIAKEAHAIGESRLKNLQETQVLAKEAHAIGESRLKNLQETQVLAKESKQSWIDYKNLLQKKYDSNIELINHLQEDKAIDLKIIDCYEKILAIVMKNPSKYEGMSLKDFSEVSEVANTKNDLNEIVEIKVKDYPQEHRNDLINVASKVIAHSLEKKSLVDLEQKIDLALSKEILIKIDKFDKSPVSIYRTNQYLYNQHYFSNIKNYNMFKKKPAQLRTGL
jgi:hypothetical protein